MPTRGRRGLGVPALPTILQGKPSQKPPGNALGTPLRAQGSGGSGRLSESKGEPAELAKWRRRDPGVTINYEDTT